MYLASPPLKCVKLKVEYLTLLCCPTFYSVSLKKTLTAREFSELLGEIRTRLEYTQVDGTQIPVKYVFLIEYP